MNYKRFMNRFFNGIEHIKDNNLIKGSLLACSVSMLFIWLFRANIFATEQGTVVYAFITALLPMLYILIFIAVILFMGQVVEDAICTIAFRRIGLKNSVGETPYLLYKHTNNNLLEVVFIANGVPLERWENNQAEIENVLNMTISEIAMGDNMQKIILRGLKGKNEMTEPVCWKDEYQPFGACLRLGESYGQPVLMDLNSYAHALIGGATGSGKTWLLQHMLYQCILKGYEVHIIDYKGGIDFPVAWSKYCTISDNDEEVIKQMDAVIGELEHRKVQFLEDGCKNIEEYNQAAQKKLNHIVVACDELAEMLDMTGASKERKAAIRQIDAYISSIARLGRAFGIHLFLSTQRPDADVLNGQIKANLTYKICGRADAILSRIILDNSDAADKIPKDAKGVFLNQDGTLFKGYTFDINNVPAT